MLSILIPIYNYDITDLVRTLQEQAQQLAYPVEIICMDDASLNKFKLGNRVVSNWQSITYLELPNNVGRSKIRNLLGEKAQYDYLIFMDCDSGIVNSNYLKNYETQLPIKGVICGGRVYSEIPPLEKDYFFHWKYGSQKEVRKAAERSQDPYHGFMSNNFLVDKQTFQKIGFDEALLQYGHEDTLFGMQLEQFDIPILHIDNPLEHLGLESNETFLRKTIQGIQNLALLKRKYPTLTTKLTQTAERMNRYHLSFLFNRMGTLLMPILNRHLQSNNPSLNLFNLYKLIKYLEEEK